MNYEKCNINVLDANNGVIREKSPRIEISRIIYNNTKRNPLLINFNLIRVFLDLPCAQILKTYRRI